jgi:hypothetical protein
MSRTLHSGHLIESLEELEDGKPNPINAVAVRTQDIRVRSMLIRARSQAKWVSFWCSTPGLTLAHS